MYFSLVKCELDTMQVESLYLIPTAPVLSM